MSKQNYNLHMLIFMISWTVCSFNYYLVIFHFQKMAGSIYLNGISVALAEIAGCLIVGEFIKAMGVKDILDISYGLMLIATMVYMFPILSLPLWYAVILFFMRLGHTCAFAATFYGTNSLFMEEISAIIFASCNLVARFLTIFAPLIANSDGGSPMFWYMLFTIVGLVVI